MSTRKQSFFMDKPKFLDLCREVLRLKHYSLRTEQAYCSWIKRYILFHHKRHPSEMGESEIRAFLADLAVNGNVAASTQTVALSALLFLYRDVLKIELPFVGNIERAKKPQRLPEVFTQTEAKEILARLQGAYLLMAGLLYGAGLRLMEAVRLRVKDLDFEMEQIIVRDSKGEKDRVTMLPQSLTPKLCEHLAVVQVALPDVFAFLTKSPPRGKLETAGGFIYEC